MSADGGNDAGTGAISMDPINPCILIPQCGPADFECWKRLRTVDRSPQQAVLLRHHGGVGGAARGGQRVTAEFGRGPIMRQYRDLYHRLTGA